MYKINFNHLYYFLSISKAGSIVEASKKLNITQPALSHQLKILEQDLGKKLFDRIGRRLIINESGKIVKQYANTIFRHSEEMIEYLKSETEIPIDIIKVGISPFISRNEIYTFIKPLIENKNIKIQVYQKDREQLLTDMQSNYLDIVLSDSAYTEEVQDLDIHNLTIDTLICTASSQIGFQGPFPQRIEERELITLPRDHRITTEVEDYLRANQISVNIAGEFSDISLLKMALIKGKYIGFLPFNAIKKELHSKLLIQLAYPKQLEYKLWAITNKKFKRNTILSSLYENYEKKVERSSILIRKNPPHFEN